MNLEESKSTNNINLLLIYPGSADGFSSYSRGRDWCNHGIGIISSILKQKGYKVDYLDCRRLSGWEDVRKHIQTLDFDLALISIASVDFDASCRIARIIKEKKSALKVMVGGPHATLMLEQTAGIDDFDYIFTHEAEITLPKLLERFPDIPRITRGEIPADLDAIPFVDRELEPKGETSWFKGLGSPFFSITASRGCLYNCSFCQPAERDVFGDKVRKRSVDNVLNELSYLSQKYKMNSFMIHDDCFTQYSSWAEEFCKKKAELKLTQGFACQSRADIICRNPELMAKLYAAGLRWVLVGFESGSDRVLKYIRKGVTLEQNLKAAEICKKIGINIFANYMFGLPTETKAEMEQTVDMIRKIRPGIYSPATFTPAPGSDLYKYCLENDWILIDSSKGYRRDPNSGKKIKGVDYDLVGTLIFKSRYGRFLGAAAYRVWLIKERFSSRYSGD